MIAYATLVSAWTSRHLPARRCPQWSRAPVWSRVRRSKTRRLYNDGALDLASIGPSKHLALRVARSTSGFPLPASPPLERRTRCALTIRLSSTRTPPPTVLPPPDAVDVKFTGRSSQADRRTVPSTGTALFGESSGNDVAGRARVRRIQSSVRAPAPTARLPR